MNTQNKKKLWYCSSPSLSLSQCLLSHSPHVFLFVSKLIESELKRLRLLTRRMTGKDLDGLTFAELLLLESLLKQVLLIVKKLKVREREYKQP